MEKLIERVINRNKKYIEDGVVANYIPALELANKEDIELCIIKGDEVFTSKKDCTKFTIQSISKVFSLMLALMDHGEDYVFERVGTEGTDDVFNSGYKLDISTINKPTNPMMNAGAILTTSLVDENDKSRYERILEIIRLGSKNKDIGYNKEVYLSESETGDKNRALAYQMKARGMINGDVEEILDSYFKQCSIEVTVVDIANLGNFISSSFEGMDEFGKIERHRLRDILMGIMINCGMYNYSGRFMIEVGMPSKSGVGGGIMSVPKGMGIGVYSPGLDENGNSKVGYEILKDLRKELNIGLFD